MASLPDAGEKLIDKRVFRVIFAGISLSLAVTTVDSDPVLVPTDNSWLPGIFGAIRREVGSQHSLGESNVVNSAKNKLTSLLHNPYQKGLNN
ncbi:hypothetical protein KIW84_075033 [Lathyrus oleraceus]|uniref:Uncharacterized protein n=1 Tax=Pisum sativum TaxID=3888 RepID=A0A9D5A0M2_PEA|nr:hypothetical protein KIW84_075033 [Pisum sativum]